MGPQSNFSVPVTLGLAARFVFGLGMLYFALLIPVVMFRAEASFPPVVLVGLVALHALLFAIETLAQLSSAWKKRLVLLALYAPVPATAYGVWTGAPDTLHLWLLSHYTIAALLLAPFLFSRFRWLGVYLLVWAAFLLAAAGATMPGWTSATIGICLIGSVSGHYLHKGAWRYQFRETLFERVFGTPNVAMTMLGGGLEIQMASRGMANLTGYSEDELLGRSLADFLNEEDLERLRKSLGRHTTTGAESFEEQVRIYNRAGKEVWAQLFFTKIEGNGHESAYFVMVQNITRQKWAQEKLTEQSYYDDLTGLPNRNLLGDRLTLALAKAKRDKKNVTLVALDIDRFSELNRQGGFQLGNEVIVQLGHVLARSVRDSDTVCRLGDDEFLLLLPGTGPGQATESALDRIRSALKSPVNAGGQKITLQVSMGVAAFPDGGDGVDELLLNCETALERARKNGGNQTYIFGPGTN